MNQTRSRIIGTGAYIPPQVVTNEHFLTKTFVNADGSPMKYEMGKVIEKFGGVAGIKERRYAKDEYQAADLGTIAARKAIESAGIDPETIDYIILAHNFGDVPTVGGSADLLPNLAARIKHQLGIKNSF